MQDVAFVRFPGARRGPSQCFRVWLCRRWLKKTRVGAQLRKAIGNLTRHCLASATQCALRVWVALPVGLAYRSGPWSSHACIRSHGVTTRSDRRCHPDEEGRGSAGPGGLIRRIIPSNSVETCHRRRILPIRSWVSTGSDRPHRPDEKGRDSSRPTSLMRRTSPSTSVRTRRRRRNRPIRSWISMSV